MNDIAGFIETRLINLMSDGAEESKEQALCLEQSLEELQQEVAACQSKRATLGLFNRSTKREIDNRLSELAGLIGEASAGLEEIKSFESVRNRLLKWRVLDVDERGKRVLVITEECVSLMPYHQPGRYVTWSTSTLRFWLNTFFFRNLPQVIQDSVVMVTNENNVGKDTNDRVFLLSVKEAVRYFRNNEDKVAMYNDDHIWWWLRSQYRHDDQAAFVDLYGNIGQSGYHGYPVWYSRGVRPAMWLNLDSSQFGMQ